jgi:quercetin dioxygenase-like cupin family protein
MAEELTIGPGTILRVVSVTPEELEFRASYAPGGSPPPAHFHPQQDERFEMLTGTMLTRVNGDEGEIATGDVLEIPRGAVHQIWNGGEEPAEMRWLTMPSGRTLAWFRELAKLAAGDAGVEGATLLERFADTFRLASAGETEATR